MKKQLIFVVPLFTIVASIAWYFPKSRETPQVNGADLLDTVFRDARQIMSHSMVEKADNYFHGGVVNMDCNHINESTDEHRRFNEDDGDHDDEKKGFDDHHEEEEPKSQNPHDRSFFSWMNSKIHVQEHSHLEGEKLNELLPWLWAAVKSNPKNVEAYEMGWYVLAKMQKKPDKGIEVLLEGIKQNPESPQLEFTLGQSLRKDKSNLPEAEKAFQRACKKSLATVDGQIEKFDENGARLFSSILSYLAVIARDRDDFEMVRFYFVLADKIKFTEIPQVKSVKGIYEKMKEKHFSGSIEEILTK